MASFLQESLFTTLQCLSLFFPFPHTLILLTLSLRYSPALLLAHLPSTRRAFTRAISSAWHSLPTLVSISLTPGLPLGPKPNATSSLKLLCHVHSSTWRCLLALTTINMYIPFYSGSAQSLPPGNTISCSHFVPATGLRECLEGKDSVQYLFKPHLIILFLHLINVIDHNYRNKSLLPPQSKKKPSYLHER